MGYLVCDKCRAYYKLQKGESPDNFSDECPCGGHFIYRESIISEENIWSKPIFRITAILIIIIILILLTSVICQKSSFNVYSYNENEKYNPEQIDCFMETVFSQDYYGNRHDKIGKWNTNFIRIKVNGYPTEEDLKTLNETIKDINSNVKVFQMKINDHNDMEPDLEIYFVPHSEFTKYNLNPQEIDGFTDWKVSSSDIYGGNPAGEIFKTRVFIGIDGLSQKRRSHVIVHEMAHNLGFHHNNNRNSALCKNGPDLTKLSDLDKSMIRMLYRKDILPYMSQNDAETILTNSK